MWTPAEEAERLALRFAKVNQAAFARAHKVPGGPSMVSQHITGRRPINLEQATAYARGFGVPLAEISPRLAAQLMSAASLAPAGVMGGGTSHAGNAHPHSAGEATVDTLGRGVDHSTSLLSPIVTVLTLDWDDLMISKLPSAFALVLRDDAMAPSYGRGGTMRFSTERRVEPGRIVLLSDRDGHAYVREYRLHRADHWLAVASNPAYAPLNSAEDGLKVLAVMTGWDFPPDL